MSFCWVYQVISENCAAASGLCTHSGVLCECTPRPPETTGWELFFFYRYSRHDIALLNAFKDIHSLYQLAKY